MVAIEKHFKFENDKTFDSEFSINKQQLKKLKNSTTEIFESLKIKKNRPDKYGKSLRRSIFVSKNMKQNEKLTRNNIISLRPNIGIPSELFFKVLGKKLNKNLKKDSPIYFRDLKNK